MTATVSVLSALFEMTVPSRTLRELRAVVSVSVISLACLGSDDLALADVGVDAGDLLAHRADLGVVVERPGGIAEAQVQRLLLRGAQLLDEGLDAELLELGVGLGGHLRTPPRE